MKIAIFDECYYNLDYIPKYIKDKMDNTKHWRIALAEVLDNLEPNCKNYDEYLINYWKKSKYEDNETCYFKTLEEDEISILSTRNSVIEINIEELDISKPWKISVSNEGKEWIEHFYGIKVLDKDINMCDW